MLIHIFTTNIDGMFFEPPESESISNDCRGKVNFLKIKISLHNFDYNIGLLEWKAPSSRGMRNDWSPGYDVLDQTLVSCFAFFTKVSKKCLRYPFPFLS
jgi:hypothetical protein